MDSLLKILTEKKRQLDKYRPLPPELIKNLEEWLKVELTYSSNAIEGNTLSRLETAEVIERGVTAVISGKPLQDQLEAINHAQAVDYIKELSTKLKGHQYISEADVLAIHKIILTRINDLWAGRYRATEIFIRGVDTEFPLPRQVPPLMKDFFRWLEGQQENHPVRIAADAHFKLVSIHPFVDGNGRTARLLMNLILLLNGYPMAIIKNEERTQYLDAIFTGQTKNDLQPFYAFIEKAVENSLDMFTRAVEEKQPVLKKFSPEKSSLKIGELAKATNETIHTIRYWTKEGLLPVAGFTKGGYQLFDPSMIERVKKIRELQTKQRSTISEIKKLL